MKPLYRTLLRLAVCCICPLFAYTQVKEQGGLMWRISGKGLTAPSYLYGTMHLADKRLFNFPDSLYAAIEKSDGYAMELDPDSLILAHLEENEKEDKKTLLKSEISAKDFAAARKRLQEVFKKPAEKVTAYEFRQYCEDPTNILDAKNKMQTVMDAWLFNTARRQGKWVGGIEDVADQLPYKDNASSSSYIKEFVQGFQKEKKRGEQMVQIYTRNDLQQLEMVKDFVADYKDSIMIRRNVKMARRMDSLAHIRSMFFAVGAAHLPGDSGVISMLRSRGFEVTPVLSNIRIHADQYTFAQKKLPWVSVQSPSFLYSVEMPGKPHKEEGGMEVDLRAYGDISTNLYYIVVAAKKKESGNQDSMILDAIKNISGNAKIIEKRPFITDSLKGLEVLGENADGVLRMRIIYQAPHLYMLTVGTADTQREYLQSEDADRFFQSLVLQKPQKISPAERELFTVEKYGFSVQFPGKPNIQDQGLAKETHVTGTVYSAIDLENNVMYQCLVQQLDKGYYITADSAIFMTYVDNVRQNKKCRLINEKAITVEGYPGQLTEFFTSESNDSVYNKVLNFHRGNRIFYLAVSAGNRKQSQQLIDDFFNSFRFNRVKENNWSMQLAPDKSFSAWTASPIERYVDSTDEPEPRESIFMTHDDAAPVTFFIRKSTFPRFFWERSDTALIRRQLTGNTGSTDSILEQQRVQLGPFAGMDVLMKMQDNHNLKKIRFLLAGDTLYTLYGIVAKEFLEQADRRKFFDQFTIHSTDTASTLFTPKWGALLEALHSKDSATLSEAKLSLSTLEFKKEDLPILHKAMLDAYPDSAEYNNVNHRLFRAVAALKDPSTIAVVEAMYKNLSPEQEHLRYELLALLAAQRTTPAVKIMKELLLQRPPRTGPAFKLFSEFDDSLALAVPVITDLFTLLEDSLAGPQIISLTYDLLDSNLISTATLLQSKTAFYERAAVSLQELKQNKEEYPDYSIATLIELLARFKEDAAWQWIRKFVAQPNMYLKFTAATTLMNHQQPVDAAAFTKLAADAGYRESLYDELEKGKKTELFPRQFLTQQAFAESELYSYASDDNDVKKITFLGQRLKTYKKKQYKFYLFKIEIAYDDEVSTYLGVGGPYHPTSTKFARRKDATGIYWDKTFNAATIDADLKAYLKSMEELETSDENN